MYIVFFVIGLLALLGQFFVEKGFFSKSLIVFSVVSFLGLGFFAYQDTKEISELNEELMVANQDLEKLKTYEYVSRLTHTGSEQVFFPAMDRNHPLIPQGLPEIMIGTYYSTDEFGSIAYKCDEIAREKYSEAIEFNPDYPFSYLALAHCKKQVREQDWRDDANKAVEIFKITTQIGGHHPEHDTGLELVQDLLKP